MDGTAAEDRALIGPAVMTARIKTIALRLGADDIRIGPLNPAWVYSHRGTPPFFSDYHANSPHFSGPPDHYRDMTWGDPIEIFHLFAISMAFSQDSDLMSTGGTPISDFEVGRVYDKRALVATQVDTYVRALGWGARAHHLRNYGVLVIPVAVDAGLGKLGRCGYMIHRNLGTNLRLACVTTDLPLVPDPPIDLGIEQFCETCTKCADNCPAGAITKGDKTVVRGVSKWTIDPVKCLLYWNHVGSACTVCQVVCPWSRLSSLPHRIAANIGKRLPGAHLALLWADNLINGREFHTTPPPTW